MKIGLFSDPHYSNHKEIGGGRKPYLSYGKIKNAMDAFKKECVDICLCLGDLTDHIEGDSKETTLSNLREILGLINSYGIPFYLVVGNHDYLALTGDDMEKEGILIPPYTVDTPEYKFVALDANYRFNMQRFDVAGVDWQDSNLPKEQIEFLEAEQPEPAERTC